MSMIYEMVGLSRMLIGAIRATPSLASDLVKVVDDDLAENLKVHMPAARLEAYEADRRAMLEASPRARAAEAQLPEARARIGKLGPIEPTLSLEQSWHIMHYVFTGHFGPEHAPGNDLLAGQPLGDDVGYGPPMLHTPEETERFAQFMAMLDLDQLQRRIDLRAMRGLGIYGVPIGRGTDAEHEACLRAQLASYFPALLDHVTRMSSKGNGLLTWIS